VISSWKHAAEPLRHGVALAPHWSIDMTKGLLLGAACALVALMLLAGGAPAIPVATGLAVGVLAVWAASNWKTRSPR
jgi:uncharacterized membrane protein